eukprot:TRINITY_DN5186_c0_g1_i2.p1 TRINITY_DN5186_c0_g1~~TRINITY_DN5186_c0_g1_i2.p1  ORF type:complete len:1026 (-),score=294.33 TRINITY_DN5186_c0_g1_i2:182-3052(-)
MTTEPTDLENVATLHLEVWDRDKMSKDDFMGQCEVVLEHSFLATCHNRPQCKSLELQPRSGRKKDKVRGCVVVRITYWSPATLRKLKFQEGGGASHTLQVIVVKGEKLVAKDANGKSDPFFKARWVGGVGTLSPEVKSTVIPRTLNPNWSHAAAQAGTDEPMLKCTVDTIDDLPRLEVEVWDRDIGSEDDFMGYVAADFDPEVLRQNDGRWWMESLILGPRESAPSRLSKRISSASLAASSPLSPRHSAPTVERSSAHASGRVFVKIQYTSPQASRMKIRKSCSSRMMLAESPQLELRFETADEHPLVIMCSLEQSLYESTVNALYSGVVTRAHSRKAITYQSSFEGSDAVEVVLLHVQSHPDWRYERVRRFFEDEACKEEIIDRFDATHLERCRQYLITNTLGEKSWSRDDAVALLQRMLDDRYFRRCTAGDSVFKDAKTLYSFESPGLKDLEALRKRTGIKSIGRAMKSEKCTPRFPVVLVPGLASTALEVWDSEEAPEWLGERVWIDVNKIGSLAQVQKVKNMLRSSKKSDDDSAPGRKWLRHLCLLDDGFSDPPGIKTRPCEGLGAIDYLSHAALTRGPSYVWSFVIRALIDLGYDRRNLIAAPYDWRLPPSKLEERDGFFSQMKLQVQQAHAINKERVVLIGHSMGCRATQWFLWWLKCTDPTFIDEHIHAFMALGPPFLGAPKLLRGSVTGDAMGLDMFLQLKEGLHLAQRLGSLPWLLPLYHPLFTNPISRLRRDGVPEPSAGADYVASDFEVLAPFKIMEHHAKLSWDIYVKNYRTPWYLGECEHLGSCTAEDGTAMAEPPLPPILEHPPVENLWCIYGVNLNTETCYYFKKKGDSIDLDKSMDRESGRPTPNNPSGLKISGGIGYETSDTAQPMLEGNARSGDGTLPYSAMAYARTWQRDDHGHVDIIEIEAADHREMMSDDRVLYHMLTYLVHGENPLAEHPANVR